MSSIEPKKHPCPDCNFCQWCSDDRCALCLRTDGCRKKLSVAEQIALYEENNRKNPSDCSAEETVDELRDYGLKIIQPKTGYRFSLDPLLLCDFAPAGKSNILDLGTGCGVIPLILARRFPGTSLSAVEVQPQMVEIARRNVVNNGLAGTIQIVAADILEITMRYPADSFDLVMSNPPYRRPGDGKVSPKAGRDIARHESSAALEDFLVVARKLVKPGGSICFIYHPERLAELLTLAQRLKLTPTRLQTVHGDCTMPARMFLIELVKGRRSALEVLPPLSVRDSRYGANWSTGMRREP